MISVCCKAELTSAKYVDNYLSNVSNMFYELLTPIVVCLGCFEKIRVCKLCGIQTRWDRSDRMSHLKVHHIGGKSCWYFDLYASHKYLKVPKHSLIRLSAVINNNPYLIFICFEFDRNAIVSVMMDMYGQNDKFISRC